MKEYLVAYRKGPIGVAGMDWCRQESADDPRELISDVEQITKDWRIEPIEDGLLCTAPDESETYEHNVTITLLDT